MSDVCITEKKKEGKKKPLDSKVYEPKVIVNCTDTKKRCLTCDLIEGKIRFKPIERKHIFLLYNINGLVL